MENSQKRTFLGKIVMQQPNGQSRVVTASSAQFTSLPEPSIAQNNERPMMLNAWTQTTPEGIDYLYNENTIKSEKQTQYVHELLEKIRNLEENLRAHSEILARMHAKQSNSNVVVQENPHHSPTAAKLTNLESSQVFQQHTTQQINHAAQLERHHQLYTQTGTHNNHNIVADNFQVQPEPIESVNYTIITDAERNGNNEPLEIQMTEENAMNCSADSGVLKICLAEETDETKMIVTTNEISVPTQMCRPQRQDSQYSISYSKRKMSDDQKEMHTSKCCINGSLIPANALKTDEIPKMPIKLKQGNANINTPNRTEQNVPTCDPRIDLSNVMVSLGPGNTRVPAKVYESISWASASLATRKLLMTLFDRQTLATHSMTGKPSPAFKNEKRPLKERLNQNIVNDIIYAVTRKCHVSEKEVRSAITTKCADENKMMKLQEGKLRVVRNLNKENINE